MIRPFIVERTKTYQVVVMAEDSREAIRISDEETDWHDHDCEDTTTSWEAGSGDVGDDEIPYGNNPEMKTYKELLEAETAP